MSTLKSENDRVLLLEESFVVRRTGGKNLFRTEANEEI